MKFCTKCNSVMHSIGNGKFECSCGNVEEGILESNEKINKKQEKGEGIIEDKNVLADFHHICKKCGYDRAEVFERQPYISDEDSLTFVRCGKCKYTEQLARKTS
jgi:DNA-directed RNA polymerase subunit M/transcription elongation factor TFIIS